MIFEYLPHKEDFQQSPSYPSMNNEEEKSSLLPSSGNSVIDKLLGRLPIWPSTPPSPKNPGLELLNLLQQQSKKESSELHHVETNQNAMNIIDRLNEAIRQAKCNNNSNSTTNADHRIAVQA